MATLNVNMILSYGDTAVQGSVPMRLPLVFTLEYQEETVKTVLIAANQTDVPIDLSTITAPKFLFARTLDVDVTLKLKTGLVELPTQLSVAGGWVMIANANGQTINSLLVTTPVSPSSGARLQIISFE